MSDKVGRNDPCPCGSGKKFKKCCMQTGKTEQSELDAPARYQFEPGTYGTIGQFMPSIACLKVTADQCDYDFVLVRTDQTHTNERDALTQAEEDLDTAFGERQKTGSDLTVAQELNARGYRSVKDFHIVT